MADYSLLDKLLHQFALGLTPIAEMSFEIDQRIMIPDSAYAAAEPHVFISGLARAGTTMLMRRFYMSGVFRSLTYRDMPFVLAPNLWLKIIGARKKAVVPRERAHRDGLMVDADSPESLDEVFWRTFAAEDYVRSNKLIPHEPCSELRAKFSSYVGAILAQSGKTRYLSKNNNNILRLHALRAIFPHALIIIPFRAPLAHAQSLLKQHIHFSRIHRNDPFVRRYMAWLCHHEFGADHRPFFFDGVGPEGNPSTMDYWVDFWVKTYSWLIERAPSDTVFVSYEALCTNPAVWSRLAYLSDVAAQVESDGGFRLQRCDSIGSVGSALAERAEALHKRLKARAARDLAVD